MIEQLTQLLFMRLVFQQTVGEYMEGSDERDGCALQKLMSKKTPFDKKASWYFGPNLNELLFERERLRLKGKINASQCTMFSPHCL